MSKKTSDRKHRFDGRTDPDRAIREVVEWAKRMRDQRKLADSKAPRFFLGYEQKDFVGRERYLARLQAALVEQPGVFLLHGEPGSGKSTLALKFAWKAQAAFDAVVFQTCGQRSAEEIAVELAGRLKLENVRAAPPEVQLEAAQNWLRERLSLLVLDDVWYDDAAKLLPGPPFRCWSPRGGRTGRGARRADANWGRAFRRRKRRR